MPFVEKDLLSYKTVALSVFVLTNHDALMVEKDILDSKKQILAFGKPLRRYHLSTCKNLQIRVMGVKDRHDEDVWNLVNILGEKEDIPSAKEITHTNLQGGYGHSYCEFFFKKCLGHEEVDNISCVLEISQQDKPRLELRITHIMDADDVQQRYRFNRMEKLSDEDIRLITHKADLVKADLDNLFGELGISAANQDLGRRNANTNDFKHQGFEILRIWHQSKGQAANRNSVIKALQRSNLINARELIVSQWGLE